MRPKALKGANKRGSLRALGLGGSILERFRGGWSIVLATSTNCTDILSNATRKKLGVMHVISIDLC
jgi:hypothetical protein